METTEIKSYTIYPLMLENEYKKIYESRLIHDTNVWSVDGRLEGALNEYATKYPFATLAVVKSLETVLDNGDKSTESVVDFSYKDGQKIPSDLTIGDIEELVEDCRGYNEVYDDDLYTDYTHYMECNPWVIVYTKENGINSQYIVVTDVNADLKKTMEDISKRNPERVVQLSSSARFRAQYKEGEMEREYPEIPYLSVDSIGFQHFERKWNSF